MVEPTPGAGYWTSDVAGERRGFQALYGRAERRDVESMLDELDAEVEWYPATVRSLGGEATVFRGHIGIRELFRDLYEALGVSQAEYWEIRDLGDRIVALGHWITRGERERRDHHASRLRSRPQEWQLIRVRTYLDRQQALEVGLRE
jgi:hypothetical protein